ncbi:PsiF family protein [Pseudomonas aeruginosa]
MAQIRAKFRAALHERKAFMSTCLKK